MELLPVVLTSANQALDSFTTQLSSALQQANGQGTTPTTDNPFDDGDGPTHSGAMTTSVITTVTLGLAETELGLVPSVPTVMSVPSNAVYATGSEAAGSEGSGSSTHASGEGSTSNSGSQFANETYAQKTYSNSFSAQGAFAEQTVSDVANVIRSGALSPTDVPIQYIVQDGNTLILNTRSAQALEQAGIPRSQWNGVDVSRDAAARARLIGQLQRNGLTSQGTTTVKLTGDSK